MRSIWKGHIRFSLVTIPVQIFSAVESKSNVSFKQIHKEDNGPVGYKKYCKVCKETMRRDDIVKGFEYEPDHYVVFEDEELEKIKLESTKAIDIEAFVEASEVHPSRYEAVYYVGPEGKVAHKTFGLLCTTLKETGKAGIGRIILRDREDVVMITPHENALIMYKLRYPYELRDIAKVPDTDDLVEPAESELKLAKQLVDSLSMSFEEVDFEDRYRDALLELVERKVEGKEIVSMEEDGEDKPVVDIMVALKRSIEEAKKKKSA